MSVTAAFILIMHILSHESEKCVTERNKRMSLWRLFINSVSSWFWLNESLKMTCTRSNARYLDFLSNGERLDYFSLPNVLPTLCKITESVSKNEQVKMINFELSKYTKMNINFELFKISKMSSLEIYISPVTEMLQASNLWYINFVCVFYITFGCYL